jgi:A/G-specific adenine glycosylase
LTTPRSAALLDWYRNHRRVLPWRDETDPYRILVSEVMLQQTQASRVGVRYVRFLDRFPTVDTLATAPVATVIEEWQGLGYNRRAIRLQQAAADIAANGWPSSYDDLQRLPGVGPYTAAAVACFAFGLRIAAPDTNARRVLSRWHGVALSGRSLWEAAEDDLPDDAPAWNQAVMDLGAAVCTPRDPQCDVCPVTAWCADPSVYSPPRPQGRFEGSRRQARGAVVHHLVGHSSASVDQIAVGTGIEPERIASAVDALVTEGLVCRTGSGTLSLPAD